MKVPKCRALLIGYALAAGAFADWPAMQYRITMLADLPGPGLPTCRPEEISDDGTAVGRSFGAAEQGLQAVLWNGTGTVVHLGELPGGNHQSYGYGVNSIGHAAGYCIVSVGGQAVGQAFLWTPQAGMIGLGDLPGSLVDSAGYAINDDDHIVGVSLSSNGNEGFLWTSESGMVGLGDLPGGQFISVPMDINNSDQVVGWSVSDEADEVFIWDAQNGMRSLGRTPTGGIAYTAAINDAGQVAGDLYEPDVGYFSYIWTEADGFLILPGYLAPNSETYLWDINDRGDVFVWAAVNAEGWLNPFLWNPRDGYFNIYDAMDPCETRISGPIGLNNHWQLIAMPAEGGQGAIMTPWLVGDLNEDRFVTVQDLALLLANFGRTDGATSATGDSDCDGDVDLQDLARLLSNFGQSLP